MSSPRFAFFQGKIVPIEQAKVSVMTHALNYGTAVFGGMRGYWNAEKGELFLFRPIDHFIRLKQSAEFLLMDVPYTPEQLRAILVDLLRHELPPRYLHPPVGLQVARGHRACACTTLSTT